MQQHIVNLDFSSPTVSPHPQSQDWQRLAGLEQQFYRQRLIRI
jgi:hypothetical protein